MACHGPEGVAAAPQWPNLAGQHETYLLAGARPVQERQPCRPRHEPADRAARRDDASKSSRRSSPRSRTCTIHTVHGPRRAAPPAARHTAAYAVRRVSHFERRASPPPGPVGFAVDAEQSAALAAFVELLLKWNKVYNLTGVRGADEVVDRHLVESFALRALLRGTQVADVGSGGGLPGLPLAIVEPERRFTLIESRAKRVRFLRHVVAELKLANTEVAHGRAEDLRVERPFATVLARAVAPPAELLSICRHLTAPGSILLLLTATHLQDAFRGLAPDFLLQPVAARTGLNCGARSCCWSGSMRSAAARR